MVDTTADHMTASPKIAADTATSLDDFMPGGVLAPKADPRPNLLGMNADELTELFDKLGEPKFRAKQLYSWIYNKGAVTFDDMTNISKELRSKLEKSYRLTRPEVSQHLVSKDGTEKWLLKFEDGNEAETVFIPDDERGTLCISSQVGCTLTCRFCHTGTQTLVRNLTAGEIIAQIMMARDSMDEWPSDSANRRITNVVLMGMGEPLYNTDNVIKALKMTTDGHGLALSKRRITLSTSGVVPEISRVGAETGVLLAISLHATNDELRNNIMPINRKYPLEQLVEAVRNYPGLNNANRVTWEYVMLKDKNDSAADAKALIKLIEGIPSKVNLIPFNPWPGSPYARSNSAQIKKFADIIWDAGYSSPIRRPRGQDILAACGQLKSESARVPAYKKRLAAGLSAD